MSNIVYYCMLKCEMKQSGGAKGDKDNGEIKADDADSKAVDADLKAVDADSKNALETNINQTIIDKPYRTSMQNLFSKQIENKKASNKLISNFQTIVAAAASNVNKTSNNSKNVSDTDSDKDSDVSDNGYVVSNDSDNSLGSVGSVGSVGSDVSDVVGSDNGSDNGSVVSNDSDNSLGSVGSDVSDNSNGSVGSDVVVSDNGSDVTVSSINDSATADSKDTPAPKQAIWSIVDDVPLPNEPISLSSALDKWDGKTPLIAPIFFKQTDAAAAATSEYCIEPVANIRLCANLSDTSSMYNQNQNVFQLVKLTKAVYMSFLENQVKESIVASFNQPSSKGGAKQSVYNLSQLARNETNKNNYYVYA